MSERSQAHESQNPSLHKLPVRNTEITDQLLGLFMAKIHPELTCCGKKVSWRKYPNEETYEAKCPECGRDFAYSEEN